MMLTNAGIFLRGLDLRKYFWYPKRKLGITMHSLENAWLAVSGQHGGRTCPFWLRNFILFIVFIWSFTCEIFIWKWPIYYSSCTPLRFDSSVSSLEVITDRKQVNSTRRLGRHIGFSTSRKGLLRFQSELSSQFNFQFSVNSTDQMW